MEINWWTTEPRPELSQGDLVEVAPFLQVTQPLTPLAKVSCSGKVEHWNPLEPEELKEHVLAKCKTTCAIVISHDCEIDKPKKKQRILIAAAAPFERLSDHKAAEAVRKGEHRAFMYLPNPPTLTQDHYLDLRTISAVAIEFLQASRRLASLSDSGRTRLGAQLLAFLIRKDEQ